MRGEEAIRAVVAHEKSMHTWLSPARAIANNNFERLGFLQRRDRGHVFRLTDKVRKFPLRESIVINDDGKIAFRIFQVVCMHLT